MRRVMIIFGTLLLAAVAWYQFSPIYTLNQMRKAAAAGNAAKLSNYVDYQALKIDMKDELRREILLEAGRRGAERYPLTKLGADIAVALVRPGVDLLVTPEAVQAMFDANSAAATTGRGPAAVTANAGSPTVGVMPVAIPKADAVIERHGLSEFKVKAKGKDGAAVFRRYGLGWKLAGIDMPYQFGPAQK